MEGTPTQGFEAVAAWQCNVYKGLVEVGGVACHVAGLGQAVAREGRRDDGLQDYGTINGENQKRTAEPADENRLTKMVECSVQLVSYCRQETGERHT